MLVLFNSDGKEELLLGNCVHVKNIPEAVFLKLVKQQLVDLKNVKKRA